MTQQAAPTPATVAPGTAGAPGVPRPLRRDAQRNRDALVAAARTAFAADGLEVSLERIARDAGVAIGTLYRHFPTRGYLISAVFAEKMRVVLDRAERAVAEPDAWTAFAGLLETLCEMQAGDLGFCELAALELPPNGDLALIQQQVAALGGAVLDRGQRAGAIRPDLAMPDLFFLVWSQSRIIRATAGVAPRVWRRHLYLLLDAYRADRAHPLPEPPLTEAELPRCMARLGDACTR
ncbi:TetR/AcrR family transcriptional regulator [Pilimelia anulata]|nr:TetR/AcrR family transcriptional regulator [Pilimelia anulata]